MKSTYEAHAKEVADQIGITVTAVYQGGECPVWHSDGKQVTQRTNRAACRECNTVHGDKYRVTIKRTKKAMEKSISFDFWASWADCYVEIKSEMIGSPQAFAKAGLRIFDHSRYHAGDIVQKKHKPGYYDILSCVASDISSPTDPDEVFEEYGPMQPSRAAEIASHARKLQSFFTEQERQLLAEVQ